MSGLETAAPLPPVRGGGLAILVPGEAGVVQLVGLRRLEGGGASHITQAGDFRERPGSRRYADLVRAHGPVHQVDPRASGDFVLQTDGDLPGDRSFELPVALCHLACAAGMTLASRLDQAERIVLAAGALDGAGQILPFGAAEAHRFELACKELAEHEALLLPGPPGAPRACADLAQAWRLLAQAQVSKPERGAGGARTLLVAGAVLALAGAIGWFSTSGPAAPPALPPPQAAAAPLRVLPLPRPADAGCARYLFSDLAPAGGPPLTLAADRSFQRSEALCGVWLAPREAGKRLEVEMLPPGAAMLLPGRAGVEGTGILFRPGSPARFRLVVRGAGEPFQIEIRAQAEGESPGGAGERR